MISLFRKKWYLPAIAVLLFATTSFGSPSVTTVQVTFQSGSGVGFGGVSVDPYTATVGGSTTQVLCDDWSHEVVSQETWTATAINLASAGTSSVPPRFVGSGSVTTQQLYDALAYLASQIIATPPNASTQIQDSYAMWDLTCQYITPSCTASVESAYTTAGGDLTALQLVESQALSNGATANLAGWEILTPVAGTNTCPTGVTCPTVGPQEFLVYTPEPSSVALAGTGLLGLLGFALVFRRRLASSTH